MYESENDHGCPHCGAPQGECSCEMELDELDTMAQAAPNLPDDEPMPEELDDMGDECPECGAPPGEPCDPQCPNAEEPEGVDPDRAWDTRFEAHEHASPQVEPGSGNHPSDCECETCEACNESVNESTNFDKFMSRIISEETKPTMSVLHDSPHRKRALREQERPLGRTRIGGK